MKTEFEKPRDFDFTVNRVIPRRVNGRYNPDLVSVGFFTLFGISVIEARSICKHISATADYVCSCKVIKYEN